MSLINECWEAYEEARSDDTIEWCLQGNPGRTAGAQQERFLITKSASDSCRSPAYEQVGGEREREQVFD